MNGYPLALRVPQDERASKPGGLRRTVKQLRNYGDKRQVAWCVYCRGDTETRDHVPSKIFLDKPYPSNLPVVPACDECNNGFSLDEEYVGCLIECVQVGFLNIDDIQREKIKRILERNQKLASMLLKARVATGDSVSFEIEFDRVRHVVMKLGRGHAAFELNEPRFDDPTSLTISPLLSMTPDTRECFETPPRLTLWPEVGSRAMQRGVVDDRGVAGWIIAQPERYRYLTSVDNGVIVRVVLGEYLGCEVMWADY